MGFTPLIPSEPKRAKKASGMTTRLAIVTAQRVASVSASRNCSASVGFRVDDFHPARFDTIDVTDANAVEMVSDLMSMFYTCRVAAPHMSAKCTVASSTWRRISLQRNV